MKRILSLTAAALLAAGCQKAPSLTDNFRNPPLDSRPGVYWYFMDGNMSREGISKDLQAMKKAGIGYAVFLEVNVGIPQGPTKFMSGEWVDKFSHAVSECRKYDVRMILGLGPGWTGSGGPWVEGKESMRHLMPSEISVAGNGTEQTLQLPLPAPHTPFFGEGTFTGELKDRWQEFYEDVAVVAFPKTEGGTVTDLDEKALYIRAPYSSAPAVKQFLTQDSKGPAGPRSSEVIDLTALMDSTGTLTWKVPNGEWTVMRLVSRNNGAVTRPAPYPGLGFECDKMDSAALRSHLSHFTDMLLEKVGRESPDTFGGLAYLHMDSWEMGAQNWTGNFREEFARRRGYDPLPYYPVYAGHIIGTSEESERFLWDLRQTCQELVLEKHVDVAKEYAHNHGYSLSIEPYDMNPTQDLELAVRADMPMCEFWSRGYGFNTSFAVIEGTSAAHLLGQGTVPSEAFTSHMDAYRQYPGSIKAQTDWAFAAGISRLVFHTFQHQCLPDSLQPGMTMGPYGVHWDRNETWWDMSDGYHSYVSRSQHLLQQGRCSADILYLNPENAPHVFRAPASALAGTDTLPDKRGYGFDACPPGMLMKASADNGEIVFPSGARYRVLVLPDWPTMTPELLSKIGELAAAGATIVGNPPLRSPSLSGYPGCDSLVRALADSIWSSGLIIRPVGCDSLYQPYGETAALLEKMGISEDFSCGSGGIRYIHRILPEADIYFVSNRTPSSLSDTCLFRVSGRKPYRFDPISGRVFTMPEYSDDGRCTRIPLELERNGAYFVVFADCPDAEPLECNFPKHKDFITLAGPWETEFLRKWGPAGTVTFDTLSDWSADSNPDIRYYSGTAVYRTSFCMDCTEGGYVLDLGDVGCIARVRVNGKDTGTLWTHPWRTDITPALVKGTNTLEIEVANLWQNRLIGDARKPYDGPTGGRWPEWLTEGRPRPCDRSTFCSAEYYNGSEPLLPSGLIGPVRILRY